MRALTRSSIPGIEGSLRAAIVLPHCEHAASNTIPRMAGGTSHAVLALEMKARHIL